jgi:hypothetical protein
MKSGQPPVRRTILIVTALVTVLLALFAIIFLEVK